MAVIEKLQRSYRVKLGLAKHYQDPKRHLYGVVSSKQEEKVESYTEILEALEEARLALSDTLWADDQEGR